MSERIVHVVGAGLAGLSAAVRLAERGERVVLYEAAKAAGGRCRSYHDAALDLTIDNGNHLILSGNRAAMAYLRLIGGRETLHGPDEAVFDFADLRSGERWQLRPNAGRLPWWILVPSRRVPGTALWDYLAPLRILSASRDATIGEVMRCEGPLWERLWHPVLLAALNTEPDRASARLAAPILRETLGAGGGACIPLVATEGLSAAFIDPALAYLAARGAVLKLGTRLKALSMDGNRASGLAFATQTIPIGPQDEVVLALPPAAADGIVPAVSKPTEFRGIVNAHFRTVPSAGQPLLLGLVGGLSEWLFAYPDRLSVTISAGDRLFDTPREELAERIWAEIAPLSGLPVEPMPVWQIVKERRATFAATPCEAAKRPPARTDIHNLVLAGDWIDTGLPATIEGAIRSGEMAASLLHRGDSARPVGVSKVDS